MSCSDPIIAQALQVFAGRVQELLEEIASGREKLQGFETDIVNLRAENNALKSRIRELEEQIDRQRKVDEHLRAKLSHDEVMSPPSRSKFNAAYSPRISTPNAILSGKCTSSNPLQKKISDFKRAPPSIINLAGKPNTIADKKNFNPVHAWTEKSRNLDAKQNPIKCEHKEEKLSFDEHFSDPRAELDESLATTVADEGEDPDGLADTQLGTQSKIELSDNEADQLATTVDRNVESSQIGMTQALDMLDNAIIEQPRKSMPTGEPFEFHKPSPVIGRSVATKHPLPHSNHPIQDEEVLDSVNPSPVIQSRQQQNAKRFREEPKMDDSYDNLPEWNRGRDNKQPCVEVVRKKVDRKYYQGVDCAECRAYYEAVGGEHREVSSRHRCNQQLPDTPEGFWDLSMRDNNNKDPEIEKKLQAASKEKIAQTRRRRRLKMPDNFQKAKLREAQESPTV